MLSSSCITTPMHVATTFAARGFPCSTNAKKIHTHRVYCSFSGGIVLPHPTKFVDEGRLFSTKQVVFDCFESGIGNIVEH